MHFAINKMAPKRTTKTALPAAVPAPKRAKRSSKEKAGGTTRTTRRKNVVTRRQQREKTPVESRADLLNTSDTGVLPSNTNLTLSTAEINSTQPAQRSEVANETSADNVDNIESSHVSPIVSFNNLLGANVNVSENPLLLFSAALTETLSTE